MAYIDMSDEDKIEQAIKFVAIDQPIPPVLVEFLQSVGLYDLIVSPGKVLDYATGEVDTNG